MKTVVITGASSGIGRCTAAAFGAAGWKVGLLARGRAGLESIRAELAAAGVSAAVMVVDVVDGGTARHRVKEALAAAKQRIAPTAKQVDGEAIDVSV